MRETQSQILGRLAAERARDDIRDYIRAYYGVPAEVGQRVAYTWRGRREGTIVGFIDSHLLVTFDGEREPRKYHPTWEIEYLTGPPPGVHEFIPCDDDPLECVGCRAQEP